MFNTSSGAETVAIAVGRGTGVVWIWPCGYYHRVQPDPTRPALWDEGHERSAVNVQET